MTLNKLRNLCAFTCLIILLSMTAQGEISEASFLQPPKDARPETWFHLIGGNVSKAALTTDLEAVSQAGLRGIQLFHGKGGKWPGVQPQIACLSPSWDDMIAHVGNETERLGLQFTMQNCPGWAMSGGPWITPDKAMRHLIWSRVDVMGGVRTSIKLDQPQPSQEDWRDYREVAVLAFPTPEGDTGYALIPDSIQSNQEKLSWMPLLQGKANKSVRVNPSDEPVWLEVSFNAPVTLRTIELPPVENMMMRRNFDPDSSIRLLALVGKKWVEVGQRTIPRGVWQDRLPEMSLFLAFQDMPAKTFRIVFENKHPMQLDKLQLFSAARSNDWRGQAGFALRSLERMPTPEQNQAAWVQSSDIIDLSQQMQKDGTFSWDAPKGNWTIVRFGHVNTGVKNKPAPDEATGFECDKLSPLGAEQHFAGYIGRLTKQGGPIEGQLKGMLIDSWECYTQTWTPAMEQEFKTRRGYTLRNYLPALAGWVIDDHRTSERFLRDWRATISDLLVENYFGRLAELGRERGLKLSFETAIGDVSPGDILQYFSKADIPMCEFWQPNDPHWGGFETKPIHPTASAAHVYGKPIIAAESFTNIGLKWNEHPYLLKQKADQHFTMGINHLVFHTYTHNPRLDVVPGTSFGGGIGTPFVRGQTWWKHMPKFTEYLARCEFMLQQGRPVADVLWYLGDDLDHKPRQDTPFPNGYQFDYVNFDALVNRITVANGMLVTPEGTQWKVLWLPSESCSRLKPETLGYIEKLLKAGAIVIGAPPKLNPSLSGGEESELRFASLVKSMWGEKADSGDRRIGKGRLLWGSSLQASLNALGITSDVTGIHAATWCHRKTNDTNIYFIAATRLSSLQANLQFRAKGQPEFWHPMTGETEPVSLFQRKGDHIQIPINLPAAGSVFVVFREGKSIPTFTKIVQDGTILLDATDGIKTDQGTPYPNYGLTQKDELQPWIEPLLLTSGLRDGGKQLLAWQDGSFTLTNTSGQESVVAITGTEVLSLDTDWQLSFPKGWDTLEQVSLSELKPWSDLDHPETKAFSGTATYSKTVSLKKIDTNSRYLLDLGRVANIAEIIVNGKTVATLWAPPFRADITHCLKAGENRIEIKVTNTWYNRLIHDASLPANKRKTWTYNAPDAKAKPEPAGIIGPVQLRIGKVSSL